MKPRAFATGGKSKLKGFNQLAEVANLQLATSNLQQFQKP
jgi:hypothetical protein